MINNIIEVLRDMEDDIDDLACRLDRMFNCVMLTLFVELAAAILWALGVI